MPLVVSKLAADLQKIFASRPSNHAIAAQKIAQAYDAYCKKGLAGGVPPLLTGAEAKRFEGILVPVLISSSGTAVTVGAAFASGIQSYWLTPPVVFTAPPILGVVTLMPGATGAAALITAALSNLANSEASCAAQIASALDVATKTVLATFSAPLPVPPVPATLV